jgi:hypothetical protein
MAKFVYEGNDDIFYLKVTDKVLYRDGEAVELTAAEANYVRQYPYGIHRLREVNATEANNRKGSNSNELVLLAHTSGMVKEKPVELEVTPSTGGHGDFEQAISPLELNKRGDTTAEAGSPTPTKPARTSSDS